MNTQNDLLRRIERARLWSFFHKDWLIQIRALLRPQLPPEYHIFVESETVLISPEEPQRAIPLLPDVSIAHAGAAAERLFREESAKATAAVVEVEEPCEVFSKYALWIRRDPENQVVAALEILSPSNKGLGNRFDQEKHLRKRTSLLETEVNLLQIDALLEGERDLPSRLAELAKFDRHAWTAFHVDGRRRLRGWGWNEQDPAPMIAWRVDMHAAVFVDLPQSLAAANDFNRWEDFLVPAENERN